jgi:lysine-N-methylase
VTEAGPFRIFRHSSGRPYGFTAPAVDPHVAKSVARSARYMARFRCLGGDCEDTCCQGWTVPLDEPTHRRLTVLAEGHPTAAKMLREGVELTPRGAHFGQLRFAESGRCGMLDERGLCGIHAQLGPSALFDVCDTYPRYYNDVNGVLELFGTMSCPEVARRCLFDDDAFALETIELDASPRKLRNHFTTDAPYYQPYPMLRARLVELLGRSGYTLSEKLLALLWIASKLGEFVRADGKKLPLLEFDTALGRMLDDDVLASLAQNYRSLELDGALALSVISAVLGEEPAAGADAAWTDHVEQRARIPGSALERAELCVTRYCQNHLFTTPYMLSESLFAYARELVRRAAVLRVLLQRQLIDFDGDAAQLDARLVDVVYRFGRRLEHSDVFGRLDQTLEQQGLSSFAHTVCFFSV